MGGSRWWRPSAELPMHRFFVSPRQLQGVPICLRGELAHQLVHVLRLRPSARIVLLDNTGWAYEVEIETLTPREVRCHEVSRSQPQTEPHMRVVLCQALTQERKFDWVLQKATELGVAAIQPVYAERCLVQDGVRLDDKKLSRWRRIVQEAAEQSARARLPEVRVPRRLADALAVRPPGTVGLLASCCAGGSFAVALRSTPMPSELWLYVGPEGGFTPEEEGLAQTCGTLLVSLGPRVLRTETAGMLALALAMSVSGEYG